MPKSRADLASSVANDCNLTDYGINDVVVNALFKSIVAWLEGKNLAWSQSRYVNVFIGPQDRTVAELLFFHYDGPPEREIGGGGEHNLCKLYLYADHCNITFVGEQTEAFCGITFKYSTRWAETDRSLLRFISQYVNAHLMGIFEAEPARFNGFDTEVEHLKTVVGIVDGVLNGQVVA